MRTGAGATQRSCSTWVGVCHLARSKHTKQRVAQTADMITAILTYTAGSVHCQLSAISRALPGTTTNALPSAPAGALPTAPVTALPSAPAVVLPSAPADAPVTALPSASTTALPSAPAVALPSATVRKPFVKHIPSTNPVDIY